MASGVSRSSGLSPAWAHFEDERKEPEAPPARVSRLPAAEQLLARLHSEIRAAMLDYSQLSPDVADIVASYGGEPGSIYTNWYVALERLGILPEEIPPLPANIVEILRKVEKTHTLMLIPAGFTLKTFEALVKSYGERHYPKSLWNPDGQNPLQFRYFLGSAWGEHGYVPFGAAHWVLMTKDVIPGSRKKSYEEQVEMVRALGEGCEIPSLRDAVAVIFLHKIATGESLYQGGNKYNWYILSTYTRVENTAQGLRVIVGGSHPSGVDVHCHYTDDAEFLGVAALWDLSKAIGLVPSHKTF